MHNEFHSLTKILTYTDPAYIPEAWKVTEYKIYQGHALTPLLPTTDSTSELANLLQSRESVRDFSSTQISFQALSFIIKNAVGEIATYLPNSKERKRRTYPSAGARYPCEVYILVTRSIEGLGVGLFHYRPDLTALESLSGTFGEMNGYIPDEKLRQAGVYIFITAVMARSIEKYGIRGYRFCHLEAGAMAQNISLVTQSLGHSTIWIGGTDDKAVEGLLDIDGVGEGLLLALALSA